MSAPAQTFPHDWPSCEHFGMPVYECGEEGEFHLTAGHVNRRRFIAALHQHERKCLGLLPGEMSLDEEYEMNEVRHALAARGTLDEGEEHPYGEAGGDWLRWYGDGCTIPITVHRAEWA